MFIELTGIPNDLNITIVEKEKFTTATITFPEGACPDPLYKLVYIRRDPYGLKRFVSKPVQQQGSSSIILEQLRYSSVYIFRGVMSCWSKNVVLMREIRTRPFSEYTVRSSYETRYNF